MTYFGKYVCLSVDCIENCRISESDLRQTKNFDADLSRR